MIGLARGDRCFVHRVIGVALQRDHVLLHGSSHGPVWTVALEEPVVARPAAGGSAVADDAPAAQRGRASVSPVSPVSPVSLVSPGVRKVC